jgi:thiamine biosynthesis lipoprotein
MACRFEVTLSGEDSRHVHAAREALDEADRLEAALTVFRDSSDVMRVNRQAADGPIVVDEELFALLDRCRTLHAETEGAFDITSTPLSRCWGFLARDGRVPDAETLDAARELVGMSQVTLERMPLNPSPSPPAPSPRESRGERARGWVRFARHGVELNLGSIGKGYAVQQMGIRLRAQGVRHALVSAASSSILAMGGRGSGWCIDLHSRQAARGLLARLFVRNGAVGTSGAGEQFVDINGTRYGHVLDPRTGWPATAGLLSATVVTRDAADADALATAFFVGGLDLARRYCDTHPDTLALLTPDDGSERPQIFGRYPGALVEDL